MKKKIICVLTGVLCLLTGWWFTICGNPFLIMTHCTVTVLLFYLLPIMLFNLGEYRLAVFVVEIIFGFMLFLWLYLNGTAEIHDLSDIAWTELLMFDSAGIMGVGCGGAAIYASSTHSQQ
ncbi:MAG: hypothetical protein IJ677_02920 [Alphaproteobacteria bacterium]|nr:hypothetical protein [Alphaproteobacteria bacterium]